MSIHELMFMVIAFLQITNWLLHLGIISSSNYQPGTVVMRLMTFFGVSAKTIASIASWFFIAVLGFVFFFYELVPDVLLDAITIFMIGLNGVSLYELFKAGGVSAVEANLVATESEYKVELQGIIGEAETVLETAKTKLEVFVEQALLSTAARNGEMSDAEKIEYAVKSAVEHVMQLLHLKSEQQSS